MTKEEALKKLGFFGKKVDPTDIEQIKWLYQARAGYEDHADKKRMVIEELKEVIEALTI